MDLLSYLLLLAGFIVFIAALVHGCIGVGFPMIATPLIALISDVQTAIVLTLIPTILINIVSIRSEGAVFTAIRKHLPLALLAMLGSALGTWLLITINSPWFSIVLAIAIFAYLVIDKVNIQSIWILKYPRISRLVFGTSAGVVGGLTNVMAPVLIMYTIEAKFSRQDTIQALNVSFMLGKLIQIVVFLYYGLFSIQVISASSVFVLVSAAALYLGIHIRKRIDAALFIRLLRLFLLFLAVALILQFILSN